MRTWLIFGMCIFLSLPAYGQAVKEKDAKSESSPKEVIDFRKEIEQKNQALRKELTEQISALEKATRVAVGAAGDKAANALKNSLDDLSKQPKPADSKEDISALEKDLKALLENSVAQKSELDAGIADAKVRGDTAWMLISSALVMFMVPGLALFYGGMVRRKNVLATMMQSMGALALVGLFWFAIGYGLAFGESVGGYGIIGWSSSLVFLQGIETDQLLPGLNISVYAHVIFQGMFAIITPALISGALAERIRFWPFMIFCLLWITLVYCPLAHMVWAFDWFYAVPVDKVKGLGGSAVGLLGQMGALDFAGGTVVHISAGAAALACILVLRKRHGYPQQPMQPNSLVLTLLGAGILWFGWFGFNGGSAGGSGTLATSAFAATQAAAAAAGLSWMLAELLHKGKATALGLASGIVAGLVAVTPAAGYVYISGGVAIGILAGVVCYFAVSLKSTLGYDDSLDAFGVHGVGGFLGAILTGIFCHGAVNSAGAYGYTGFQNLEVTISGLRQETKLGAIDEISRALPGLEEAASKAGVAFDLAKGTMAKADTDEAKTAAQPALDMAFLDHDLASGKLAKAKQLEKLLLKEEELLKSGKSHASQVLIQLKAATLSAVFAFGISYILALGVHRLTGENFTTDKDSESEGLDYTEHGEIGFDYGPSLLTSVDRPGPMPRSAIAPPSGGKRFCLLVDGPSPAALLNAWSGFCQDVPGGPSMEFLDIYPHLTTVSDNRFRFSGGDQSKVKDSLTKLLQKSFGPGVKVTVDG